MTNRRAPVPEGVPVWQPDEESSECFLCHTEYSIFFRRHHCRKCGKVVCGNCSSSRSTYLPSTYVVSPPSQIFLESPHVPHRTCDNCMEELEMVRAALRGGQNSHYYHRQQSSTSSMSSSGRRQGSEHNSSSGRRGRRRSMFIDSSLIQSAPPPVGIPDADNYDDRNHCPICGRSIKKLNEQGREEHIQSCVTSAEFSGSPEQGRRNTNRMVVHQLPQKSETSSSMGECTICFEEYKPGEKVGRLECLCVYHERCILDWFSRKGAGSCPVHAVHM